MSKKKRFGVSQALTRGLSETINVVENNSGIFRNTVLPLSRIELDPNNPRKLAINLHDIREGLDRDDPALLQKQEELEKLKEMAITIKNSGVINPIVVYKRGELYRVVAGERRCLGSILAGKLEIEARVFNEKPKGFELKLIQWIENTAREDLTLEERLGNIEDLLHEYKGQEPEAELTATILKNITGLSLSQSTYYLAVLNAPQDVKNFINSGKIRSLDKAALIAAIEAEHVRHEALEACSKGCSLKELRRIIGQRKREASNTNASGPDLLAPQKGRLRTRVNMGFTFNTEVIRAIIYSVINQQDYQKYSEYFSNINWTHYEQTTRAFRRLVQILETEMAG